MPMPMPMPMLDNYTIKTVSDVKDIFAQSEKFRNVYFWKPEASAGLRRSMERRESRPIVEWDEGGHHYTAQFDVSCTCSHTEAKARYTKDGKWTTAVAIRNSLKRMEGVFDHDEP